MSSKIDILTSGYAKLLETNVDKEKPNGENKGLMQATGSCCLVRSANTVVLFDTMGPWERELLIERLAKLGLHPEDVEHLVCSHSHPDHVGNLNLFTRAKRHFVGTSVYSKDIYELSHFEPIGGFTFRSRRGTESHVPLYNTFQIQDSPNLTLEPTPGHTMECISMVVSNCETYGTVGLVGDLFERQEDVEDESIWLGAGSQNSDLQRAHRQIIYNKVDYILPGHGGIFKTRSQVQF